jgi:murein DD-endopeptidase MepM/ murein hydrolase activator NlpD
MESESRNWLFPLLLVLVALGVLFALGCVPFDQEISVTPTPTKTPVPSTVAMLSPLPAITAVVTLPESTEDQESTASTSAGTPTAALPRESETPTLIPTFTPSSTPVDTLTASPTPTETPLPNPTETATAVPTFTPPPQGASIASNLDHYWLERPIPADYVNWTNRIYPYGSTLGGTLPTHHGVEFYNPVGVPVLAAGAGLVVTAGSDLEVGFGPHADFYGNLVVIRHEQLYQGQYLYSLYGHLSEVLVAEGQTVAVGELIGRVGGTGVANGGAHLHFEVRVGENRYEMTRNPELWLQPYPGWGTIAGQLLWPDGSFVYGASLLLRRADDPTLFVNRSISTYADDSVNPDDGWQENFTTPDLELGPYELVFRHPEWDLVIQELVWVYPNQTSFVTIQLTSP